MGSSVARSLRALVSLALLLGAGVRPAAAQSDAQPAAVTSYGADDAPDLGARARANAAYGQLPLSFEANQGQTDPSVDFLARAGGYTVLLSSSQAVLRLRPDGAAGQGEQATVIGLQLLDADARAPIVGLEPLPGTANSFLGSDPAQWRTQIPTYSRVQYQGVYPGIDLVYYGNQAQLEDDFVLAPGADPGLIRLGVQGADAVQVDAAGDLVLGTPGGELRLHAPIVYQDGPDGRQPVAGGYRLDGSTQVGFDLGVYDSARPLVIDPVLVYSTFLGGSDVDAAFGAITVDAAGSVYVAGVTDSADFPTSAGAAQQVPHGGSDVFVRKLNAPGTAVVYSTTWAAAATSAPTVWQWMRLETLT